MPDEEAGLSIVLVPCLCCGGYKSNNDPFPTQLGYLSSKMKVATATMSFLSIVNIS